MLPTRIYPSKVLLFGEYAVIGGAQALAMPLEQFSAHWAYGVHDSQRYLWGLLQYLDAKEETLVAYDLIGFRKELEQGLYLKTNIPIGYGLGSSGALCAAVYDAFCVEKTADLVTLRSIFVELENHFHGASSGTDPLISYCNKAILVASKTALKAIKLPVFEEFQFFLLDSGSGRESAPLIRWFMEQQAAPQYAERLRTVFAPLVDAAIANYRMGAAAPLFEVLKDISRFQWEHFEPMLTDGIRPIWEAGLTSDWFRLKLCGAGGGGFFLGMTRDWDALVELCGKERLVQLSF